MHGQFDYTAEFKNGVKIDYDTQKNDNNAVITSAKIFSNEQGSREIMHTAALDLTDGDGIRITGTKDVDKVVVINSKISEINTKEGNDNVFADVCTGANDGGLIYTKNCQIVNSKNLMLNKNK